MTDYESSSSTEGIDAEPFLTRIPNPPFKPANSAAKNGRGPSERFRREREMYYADKSQKHLIKTLINEEYESRKAKKMLDAALSQLDNFSRHLHESENDRKADWAHVQQLLSVQKESDTAKQLVDRYRVQLEHAQNEIHRAQKILEMVEKQRDDAEEAASKARSKARKLNEERLSYMAREEGRRAGYEEGLRVGRAVVEDEIRAQEEEEYSRQTQRRITQRPMDEESIPGAAFIEEQATDDSGVRTHPYGTPASAHRSPAPPPSDRDSGYGDYTINVRPPSGGSSQQSYPKKSQVERVREMDGGAPRRPPSVADSQSSARRRATSFSGGGSLRGVPIHQQPIYEESPRQMEEDDVRRLSPVMTRSVSTPTPMTNRRREKMPMNEEDYQNYYPEQNGYASAGPEAPSIPIPVPRQAQPSPQPVTAAQDPDGPAFPQPTIPVYPNDNQPTNVAKPSSNPITMPRTIPHAIPGQSLNSSTALPHFPMPPPPVQSRPTGPSNPTQIPTAVIPVGDALRDVRATRDPNGQMPVPVVPAGDQLRNIRVKGSSKRANGQIGQGGEGQMPTPYIPDEDGLRYIHATPNKEGQMPVPIVPGDGELQNIRAISQSGRERESATMPIPTVPTSNGGHHVYVTTRSRDGQIPVPTIPSGEGLREIHARSRLEGQMPVPEIPTGDDLCNIRATPSNRDGQMPVAVVPTDEDLANIKANGRSSRTGRREGQMPVPVVPTGEDLRYIRAEPNRDGQFPTASIPNNDDLRHVRANTSGARDSVERMPEPSIPTGEDLRNIRAARGETPIGYKDTYQRGRTSSTPTYDGKYNMYTTSSSSAGGGEYESGAGGRTSRPGHRRRGSSPESMSSVTTGTSGLNLLSFPSTAPGHHHQTSRHSRGLSAIPEATTEASSRAGSIYGPAVSKKSAEDEARREKLLEDARLRKLEEEKKLKERKTAEMQQWERQRSGYPYAAAPNATARETGNFGEKVRDQDVDEWRRSTAAATDAQPSVNSGYQPTAYTAAPTPTASNPWARVIPTTDYLTPNGVPAQALSGDDEHGYFPIMTRPSSSSTASVNINIEPPSRPPSEAYGSMQPGAAGGMLSPHHAVSSLPSSSQSKQKQSHRRSLSQAQTVAELPPGFVPHTPAQAGAGASPLPLVNELPPGFVPSPSVNAEPIGQRTPRAGASPLPVVSELPPGFVPSPMMNTHTTLPRGVGLNISGIPSSNRASIVLSPHPINAPLAGEDPYQRPSSAMGGAVLPRMNYVAAPDPNASAFDSGPVIPDIPTSPGLGGSGVDATISPSMFAKALADNEPKGGAKKKKKGRR